MTPHPLQRDAETATLRGDLPRAIALCRQILAARPTDPDATALLGMLSAKTGNLAAAETYLQNALRLRPEATEAKVALSTVWAATGKVEEAIRLATELTESAPDDPELQNHLGMTLVSAGRLGAAELHFRSHLAENPADALAARNLAMVLRDLGREEESIEAWVRVASLEPGRASAWVNAGQILLARGDFERALTMATRAIEAEALDANGHLLQGLILSELGEGDAAEPAFQRALALNPGDAIAHAARGHWLQEQGRFEKAEPLLERAIELRPTHGFAHSNLVRTRKQTEDDLPRLKQMKRLLHHPGASLQDRAYLHYALGKAYEDLGRFEDAMGQFDAANEASYRIWLAPLPWDRAAYAAKFDRLIETFTLETLASLRTTASSDETPVIVVGMIRSGTSLLEQILSSHPQVVGAGELDFWHRNEEACLRPDGSVDPEALAGAADRYRERLRELGGEAARVTDKLPHNYAQLGLIHAAFPQARILHLRRNAADNCLSIYTTPYQKPPVFAHSRENIVYEFAQYRRLMEHWRRVIPADRLLELDYEDLVADREGWARRIVQFVGLEWNEAVLHHESNPRAVRTPSLWQVRQPIYRTSVERWRRFEPWIPEFAALVAGTDDLS